MKDSQSRVDLVGVQLKLARSAAAEAAATLETWKSEDAATAP